MPPIDRLLSQYSNPVRSWPGEEDLDAEARANYAAANPPKLQTEGGSIDKGDLLPIVRYPEAKTSPSEWQSSSDVMRQLDDGWRIEPFSRLMAPFTSMAEAWRTQPVLGPMVRPSQMNPEAFNQMTSDAMTVAGTGMTGGIGRAAVAPRAPSGTFDLGMFGGRRGAEELARKGEPRPLQALDLLEQMEKAGASRDDIWAATNEILKDSPYAGAFRGVDQKPRFEIDDSGAKYTPDTPVSRVPEMVQHDPLFAAYPALMDVAAKREKALDFRGERGVNGYFDPERNAVAIHDELGRKSGKSTALHELTHAGPQEAEGFARGYNPSAAAEDIGQARLREQELREKTERWKNGHTDAARTHMARAANGDPDSAALVSEARSRWEGQFGVKSDENPFGVTPQEAVAFQLMEEDDVLSRALKEYNDVLKLSRLEPHELYKRYAGETEARTVQARQDLTPEQRRARAPWLDYDVPEKDQIVRFGNESGAMSARGIRLEPRPMSAARLHEIGDATFLSPYVIDPVREVPLSALHGQHFGPEKVAPLAAEIAQNKWIEPLVVDREGHVIEGQHRLRALQTMGVTSVPVHMIREILPDAATAAIKDAALATGIHPQQARQIAQQIAEIVSTDAVGELPFYSAPRGFERAWAAAVKATEAQNVDGALDRFARTSFADQAASSPTLMASIDPLTAAVSPPRQVDPLGYYSPTLDAALRLSQKKGTPEQMLAQLKKAGAKDSEIEVSGLKKMFEGKKSVSQEEIVKALEEGKVGLQEKVYGSPDANAADAAARATEQALREAFEAAGASPMEARMLLADASMGDVPPQYMTREIVPLVEAFQRVADETESRDLAGGPRWSAHSLDPDNPTYREVVLHLPKTDAAGQMRAAYEAAQKRHADAVARQETIDRRNPHLSPDEQAIIDEVKAATAELQRTSQPVADLNFQSGHFDEPNIVGHMMVSETRLPGNPNARVLTLDQVQSDWGQKLRDGGVRDEAKVAALDAKWKDGFAALEAHRAQGMPLRDAIASRHGLDPGNANADGWLAARGREMELPAETLQEINAYFAQRNRLMNDHRLAEAELSTAKAASPGHPLVNTTDQWLNTTLRRAIRMASEEGQDYIAIPSGHTVLSYNPGQEGGMLGFYGGTPQEMSYLVGTLRDVAKTTPDAKVIDALDPKSIDALAKAGILDKKKIEGISVSRVLKNAESRFQGIVPKNLYALLQKLDKATPPPQVIDTLDSPSGKTGLGEGFTLFKITPEAKKAAKESGQPLFRFGGRVN